MSVARIQRCLLFVGLLLAARASVVARDIDYLRDVKPIFKKHCYSCHGSLKQEGSLRVDTAAAMLSGGDSGPAIESGNVDGSQLLSRITDEDEATRMPQESAPLSAQEIAVIKAWVEQGAASPADEKPEADPRDHWAFKRPVRSAVPQVESSTPLTIRNPIDAFIADTHRQHQLQPVGETDKATLLRRVTIDLTGLPPTRDELQNFLADESPDAYERVVDRLLDSPQYGERWGRHWMDVWRYSDWYGRRSVPDVMSSYPTIWRWRDWIVRSLNEDKGYDRMIVEMLAADEVSPEDDSAIVATGFLVRNWFKWNYNQWMKDNVEHTGKAFLGLTFNCAHCHDHKYDPISQRDYFALRAFFEPLDLRQDRVRGDADPGKFQDYVYGAAYGPIAGGMIRVYDRRLDAVTRMYARGDERSIIEGEDPVEPGLPALFDYEIGKPHEVELPPVAVYPGLKPFIVEEVLATAKDAVAASEQKLKDAQARVVPEEATRIAAFEAAKTAVDQAQSQIVEQASAALAGKLSLFVNAIQGRRALWCEVASIGDVKTGTTFSLEILIEADGHTNFQLGLDQVAGKTAAFVGFEQGRIITYAPSTFNIVEIGRYNFAGGQRRFKVTGTIDVEQDLVRIDVVNADDGKAIVNGALTSLNHWNPGLDPHQGILLDVRGGAAAAFDDIAFTRPGEKPVVVFNFEEPDFTPEKDAAGTKGWAASPFSEAPATSLVSAVSTQIGAMSEVRKKLHAAQRSLEAIRLARAAAEAEVAAAHQEVKSIESRIAAGKARFEKANGPNTRDAVAKPSEPAGLSRRDSPDGSPSLKLRLATEAASAEREAATLRLKAAELATSANLAELEGKAAPDDQITAANTAHAAAQKAMADATAAGTTAGKQSEFTLLSPTYPEKSTGKRTMLARAIASRDNPLTARVAINHIWMRHFGRPLVESVFDFGRNGKTPTHPELLDWLAVEFMDNGWSMRHIHRLIVLSSAYRLDTKAPVDSANRQIDPDNKLLWRFHRNRMEAEVVRDSILFAAGQLDSTMGGPEIEIKDSAASRRRSIYLSHHGESRAPLMATFDAADPGECYRRVESVVPQQALALSNGDLSVESSRVIARKLWNKLSAEDAANANDRAFIDAAYELLLTRKPTAAERETSIKLLERQHALFAEVTATGEEPNIDDGTRPSLDPAMRTRESLCHALLNHHDFISIR
jgi:mono/diheme cytochrome c family protein